MATILKNTLLKNTALGSWNVAREIPDVKIWVDGSDYSTYTFNGSEIQQWRDKSGNGTHATQLSTSLQPTYNSNLLNGRGGVVFSSGDYLNFGAGKFGNGDSNYTFIIVGKNRQDAPTALFISMDIPTYQAILIGRYTSGGNNFYTGWYGSQLFAGSINNTNFYNLNSWYDNTIGRKHYINGVLAGSDSATGIKNTNPGVDCLLGYVYTGNVDFDMCEFIYVGRAITEKEILSLKRYFGGKYGI